MNVEKETVAILLLIGVVLVPMWSIALHSAESQSHVVLRDNKEKISPGEQFLPTPVAINEFVAGVVTWIALFVLVGMIFYTHQFVRTVGQSSGSTEDEGGRTVQLTSRRVLSDVGVGSSLPVNFQMA
ncbi:MAG: hypothetical protein ABEJ23_06355 [Haloarculaceae archaeon]